MSASPGSMSLCSARSPVISRVLSDGCVNAVATNRLGLLDTGKQVVHAGGGEPTLKDIKHWFEYMGALQMSERRTIPTWYAYLEF